MNNQAKRALKNLKSVELLALSGEEKSSAKIKRMSYVWHYSGARTNEDVDALISRGGSLEQLLDELYNLRPSVPTFRGELATQKVLDNAWLRVDENRLHEDRVKELKKDRIERLPAIQLEVIGDMIETLEHIPKGSPPSGPLREQALMYLSQKNDLDALGIIWFLGLWMQRLYMPENIGQCSTLSEYLSRRPHFRAAFDVSNKPIDALVKYINTHIDPALDLVKIGMQAETSNTIDWYEAALHAPFHYFCGRYVADRGLSLRSLTLTLNGKRLFSDDLKKTSHCLGVGDEDVIVVSRRPSSSEARVPLKQIQAPVASKGSGKPKKCLSKGTKRNRKKPTLYASPEGEIEKLKQQHSEAMSLVFGEADERFKVIRERLSALTLQRTLPKVRSKVAKHPPLALPISNLPAGKIAGKAGQTSFLVLVGDAENLYKTSKRSKGKHRQPKSDHRDRSGPNTKVDLHGLTKQQALAKLDQLLPVWVDTAMISAYPFRVTVQIVCGGGNQVLAEAVAAWIRQQTNVANVPKSGS